VRTDAQGNAAVLLPAGIERLALGAYGYETVEIGFADDGRDVVVPRREDG